MQKHMAVISQCIGALDAIAKDKRVFEFCLQPACLQHSSGSHRSTGLAGLLSGFAACKDLTCFTGPLSLGKCTVHVLL